MKKIVIAVAACFGMTAAAFALQTATQAQLQKEAKISMHHARVVALREVPHGKIQSSELEREHGKLIYSFDIRGSRGITEVNVDAINGKVVAVQHESAAREAAESKSETPKKP